MQDHAGFYRAWVINIEYRMWWLCNGCLCVCWSGWGESGQVPAVSTQTHGWEGWKLDWDIYNHGAVPFISVVRDLFWVQVYFKMHFMWIRLEMSDGFAVILHVLHRFLYLFHHLTCWGHLWHHERASPRQRQWIPNRVIDSSAGTSFALVSHTWLDTGTVLLQRSGCRLKVPHD